jgi:hypothetical protein
MYEVRRSLPYVVFRRVHFSVAQKFEPVDAVTSYKPTGSADRWSMGNVGERTDVHAPREVGVRSVRRVSFVESTMAECDICRRPPPFSLQKATDKDFL